MKTKTKETMQETNHVFTKRLIAVAWYLENIRKLNTDDVLGQVMGNQIISVFLPPIWDTCQEGQCKNCPTCGGRKMKAEVAKLIGDLVCGDLQITISPHEQNTLRNYFEVIELEAVEGSYIRICSAAKEFARDLFQSEKKSVFANIGNQILKTHLGAGVPKKDLGLVLKSTID